MISWTCVLYTLGMEKIKKIIMKIIAVKSKNFIMNLLKGKEFVLMTLGDITQTH